MSERHEYVITSHVRYMLSRSYQYNVINIVKLCAAGILGQILVLQ